MISRDQTSETYFISGKVNRQYNCFWAGLIIYSAAYCFGTIAQKNYAFAYPLQALGFLFIVFNGAMLIQFYINNKYLKLFYILYTLWFIIIILRGFPFQNQFWKNTFFDAQYGINIFFVPLILLFPQNIFFYKKIFKVIFILAGIFIVFDILFIKDLLDVSNYFTDVSSSKYAYDNFVQILSLPVGFIILTYSYHSRKIKGFSFLVMFVTILFEIYRARRGLLFATLSQLLMASVVYFLYGKRKLYIFFAYSFITLFLFFGNIENYMEKSNLFNVFSERVADDTRTPVETCFYKDMKLKDWIIGRGINGQYYCPDIDQNDQTGYREVIETNYLNIILKGGLISLSLLLLIAIPAIIKGLFYSKNILSKAAGIWILLWILDLYPVTVNGFSLNNLLVWVSIGICYNKEIRNIPEIEMRNLFLLS